MLNFCRLCLLSGTIAITTAAAAIAASPTSVELNEQAIEFQTISSGPVQVVITEYRPANYETGNEGTLAYEIYVDGNRKTQINYDSANFMVGTIELKHLDPDGVPEVIFDRFTGGAHCCSIYTIHSWQGDRLYRTVTQPLDASAAGPFKDLNGDGYSEWLSADPRFLYAFSSYASSWPPTITLSFREGSLIDTSQQFQEEMRSTAYGMYISTRQSTPKNPMLGVNGILAGYVAQKILMGEYQSGWEYMLAHFDPGDDWGLSERNSAGATLITFPDYPTALAHFLTDLGYLTNTGEPNPDLDLSDVILEENGVVQTP